jgi:BRCT domain type II-containing protein
VVGADPGGTKYRRAQELGVPTIDEEGLRRIAEGGGAEIGTDIVDEDGRNLV